MLLEYDIVSRSIETSSNQLLHSYDAYAQAASTTLANALDLVPNLPCRRNVEDAIQEWELDKVHGILHSYDVFQKSLEIADAENLTVSPPSLFLMSVVHDLSEFLPLIHHKTGTLISKKNDDFVEVLEPTGYHSDKAERIWKEQHHAHLMSSILRYFRSFIDLPLPDSIVNDIYYHDLLLLKPSAAEVERISPLLSLEGKILSDADKLVNGGASSIEEIVTFNIKRTFQYGVGREHFYRNLSPQERWLWKPRSSGYFDGLSPLVTEFSAPDYAFYTNYGKEINRQKKIIFKDQLVSFLGELHTDWTSLLGEFSTGDGLFAVNCGLKGMSETFAVEGKTVNAIASQLLNMPASHLTSSTGKPYYGYSMLIEDEWIDPSIVVYSQAEDLQHAVLAALRSHEAFLLTNSMEHL